MKSTQQTELYQHKYLKARQKYLAFKIHNNKLQEIKSMTKARDLANLLDGNGDVNSANLDNVPASNNASALTTGTLPNARLPNNISDGGTAGTKVASGTTAQRGSTTGQWRYNSTTGFFEGRGASTFSSLEPTSTITSADISEVDSTAGGNQTVVVTGTNFTSGGVISFVGSSASFNASSTTFNSVTQVTAVAPKSSFLNAQEPYKIKFTASSGTAGTSASGLINVDSAPTFGVASGTLGTLGNSNRASSGLTTVTGTDAEGDSITFAKTSGAIPTGLTLNSNGTWSGTANVESSNTTYNFTITATAGGKTSNRAYSIIVQSPTTTVFSYTGSSQTFTVPSGVTSFTAFMWGAGGTGGSTENDVNNGSGNTDHGGHGGAGAYVTALLSNYSAGQTFGILVGQSNPSTNATAINAFGGGGNGGGQLTQRTGGSGGGRSEINIGSVGNTPNGTRILVAGAGGGGNARYTSSEGSIDAGIGGYAGGGNGQGDGTPPTGGSQSAGGSRGSGLDAISNISIAGVAGIGGYATGGSQEVDTNYGAGGGGGGGYFGGGGGSGGDAGTDAQSGAGGSSYSNSTYASSVTHTSGSAGRSGRTAPQTSNTHYASGIAVGGTGRHGIGVSGTAGGHGRIVLVY